MIRAGFGFAGEFTVGDANERAVFVAASSQRTAVAWFGWACKFANPLPTSKRGGSIAGSSP